MLATEFYKKLSDTISGLRKDTSSTDVWARVKGFTSELNCHHCVALDQDMLQRGLRTALLYSDVPAEDCDAMERKGLHLGHPLETYAHETCLPFLVSDVRRDDRFMNRSWPELVSQTVLQGDAFVVPVRLKRGLAGAAFFGGREIKDSPVARSSLMVVAHAAFDRCDELLSGETPPQASLLTRRELDCLQMLAGGLADDEVARTLGISRRTVRFHVDHAKQKLGVSSRVHAVAAAVNRGLITL